MVDLSVVVGASGNIGRAMTKLFTDQGRTTLSIDLNTRPILDSVSSTNLSLFDCDVTDGTQLDTVINSYSPDKFRVRSLILCAALDSVPKGMTEADPYDTGIQNQDINAIRMRVDVNITSQLLCISKFYHHFFDLTHVTLFSSIYGVRSPIHSIYPQDCFIKPIEYSASKASILGITKHLAYTLAQDKKGRCNCLILGGLESSLHDDGFRKRYTSLVPLMRMARMADVTNAVEFLDNDRSSYITGTSLTVDGGYTIA